MKIIIRFCFTAAALILLVGAKQARADETSSSIPVHLTIIASSTQLFDGDINTVACDSDGAGLMAFTAYCAVSQAEASSSWSWWGSDAFLDSINGVANDNANGWYWGWFANLTYGETALNKYTISAGDRLLVLLNSFPLRLSADSTSPNVGSSTLFTVEEFGYDESWNPVWKPSLESHLMIGATDIPIDASGTYALAAVSAESFSVYARKDGNFVLSPVLSITPVAVPASPAADTGGGGGSTSVSVSPEPVPPQFSLAKAVAFLLRHQEADGSFGDEMYTDWAAVALKAAAKNGDAAAQAGLDKVKKYFISGSMSRSASVTDYERRALALMAVGINPYTAGGADYIQSIVDEFDGEQFGDADLVNDDIFALLALLKAGYKSDDEIIQKDIAFLLRKQQASGAWDGVDLTAAGLQALRSLSALAGVSPALVRAENYVIAHQSADGGFGNIYTLSWALQALGGMLPKADEALAAQQQADGGFREISTSDENRLWATAYAIPAALHRAWPDLLSSFKKGVSEKVVKAVEEITTGPVVAVEALDQPVIQADVLATLVPVISVAPAPEGDLIPAFEALQQESTPAPAENTPFVASAIDVTSGTQRPGLSWGIFGLALFGAIAGLFALYRFTS